MPGRKVITILSLLLFCYSFVRVLYSGIPRTSLPHARISILYLQLITKDKIFIRMMRTFSECQCGQQSGQWWPELQPLAL